MIVVWDVETANSPTEVGGWKDYVGMGFGWGCAWVQGDGGGGRMLHFEQERLAEYVELLEAADLVVTWNGKRFDVPLIQAIIGRDLRIRNHCDLMAVMGEARGRNCKLDAVAQATIRARKLGKGAYAPQLLQEGRIAELAQYCAHDVRATKDLFLFARRYGFLLDGDGQAWPIDFPEWCEPAPLPTREERGASKPRRKRKASSAAKPTTTEQPTAPKASSGGRSEGWRDHPATPPQFRKLGDLLGHSCPEDRSELYRGHWLRLHGHLLQQHGWSGTTLTKGDASDLIETIMG